MVWNKLRTPRFDTALSRLCLLGTLVAGQALTGCTVLAPRSSPLPKDGKTLVEVYRGHVREEGSATDPRERIPRRAVDDDTLAVQRRASGDPTQQRFQRLANPDLVMYVFPHLASGKYPIPGYVTVFPMYESPEYALPGETAEVSSAPRPAALRRERAAAAVNAAATSATSATPAKPTRAGVPCPATGKGVTC